MIPAVEKYMSSRLHHKEPSLHMTENFLGSPCVSFSAQPFAYKRLKMKEVWAHMSPETSVAVHLGGHGCISAVSDFIPGELRAWSQSCLWSRFSTLCRDHELMIWSQFTPLSHWALVTSSNTWSAFSASGDKKSRLGRLFLLHRKISFY